MNKTNSERLRTEDAIDLIGTQWMLVTAGHAQGFNTTTASRGGIGWLWNKPVAFVFVRPERYTHEFIEQNERLTLSCYTEAYRKALHPCGPKSGRDPDKVAPTALTPVPLESGAMTFAEAQLPIEGRKLFKAPMQESHFLDAEILERWYGAHGGLHDVYVVEIENVYEG